MRKTVKVGIGPNTILIDRKIFDRNYIEGKREPIFETVERALMIEFSANNLVQLELDKNDDLIAVYNVAED